MEAKFFIYLTLLLALIGIGYGVYHTTEIDDANKNLRSATEQVAGLETLIKNQTVYVELRREVGALMTVVNIMQKQNDQVRKEIAVDCEREIQTRRDFEQAINRSREDAGGLVINDAVLPNGIRLHNARVQRVDGDITTVVHAEGISKLSPQMLPQELRERFRFGMAVEASKPVPETAATTSDVATTPASAPLKTDLLPGARQQLEKLRKDLPYLEGELKKAEAEAAGATSPSKRFYVKNRLETLGKQIAEVKSKIETSEAEIRQLEAGQ